MEHFDALFRRDKKKEDKMEVADIEEATILNDDCNLLRFIEDMYRSAASLVATNFGDKYIAVHAATELSMANEIIVIGPPRVGKSQLISVLAGSSSEQLPIIGNSLDSLTESPQKIETDLATFWDTPGIEDWSIQHVKDFLHNMTHKRKIRPISILIIVAPGTFVRTASLQPFLAFAKSYSIQVVFVITKCYSMDHATKLEYTEKFKQLVDSDRDIPLSTTSFQIGPNAYICHVNCVSFSFQFIPYIMPPFGIPILKNIIYTKQSIEAKKELVKLFIQEARWEEKFHSLGIEIWYNLGMDTGIINENEKHHFQEIAGVPLVTAVRNYIGGKNKKQSESNNNTTEIINDNKMQEVADVGLKK